MLELLYANSKLNRVTLLKENRCSFFFGGGEGSGKGVVSLITLEINSTFLPLRELENGCNH